MQTLKRAVENPDFLKEHLFPSSLYEIRSHEGKLQWLKKGIHVLSLDGIGERLRKAYDIKQTPFDLVVAISRLSETRPGCYTCIS